MDSKDFVTYDQAIKLKELGFKEECLCYYDILDKVEVRSNIIYLENDNANIEDLEDSHNNNGDKESIDAPLLYQVKKWLQKEKGLDICTCPEASCNGKKWNVTGWIWQVFIITSEGELKNGPQQPDKKTRYSSPEEAVSAAIAECLKFLENG